MIEQTIYLEASLETSDDSTAENCKLKIGIKKSEASVGATQVVFVSIHTIEERCRDMIEKLNQVSRKGGGDQHIINELKEMGQMFCNELLPVEFKNKLRYSNAQYLVLTLDASLIHIPWELLCIDNEFLCLQFYMGRIVKTDQPFTDDPKKIVKPYKMLVLVDPKTELANASSEGLEICEIMDRKNRMDSSPPVIDAFLESTLSTAMLKEKFHNYDFVHYAGHVDYNKEYPGKSGWNLQDSSFKAEDIIKMGGNAPMPCLVFSNACQSARSEKCHWKDRYDTFGLAHSFMISGVNHYIGSSWEIIDSPAKCFALTFYENLLSGKSVGESINIARVELIHRYGPDSCWASYVLYGNPQTKYFPIIVRTKETPKTVKHSQSKWSKKWFVIIGIIVLLASLFYYSNRTQQIYSRYEINDLISTIGTIVASEQSKTEHLKKLIEILEDIKNSKDPVLLNQTIHEKNLQSITIAAFYDSTNKDEAFIASCIQFEILKKPKIILLERNNLDILQKEIKLSNQKPKFLSAHYFLFFEVISDTAFFMHLVDTKPGRVIDLFYENLDNTKTYFDQKEKIAERLLHTLEKRHP